MSNTKQRKRKSFWKKFILFSCIFLLHFSVFSQNQSVKIHGKGITIKSVFNQIEKQTGLTIAYDESALNVNQRIKGEIKAVKLSEVLSTVLKGMNLEFVFQNKHVIIRTKENNSPKNNSQPPTPNATRSTKTITGKITNVETGEPIIGASVVEKGTTNGMITDVDGNFKLSVPEDASLSVSSVGYSSQEVRTAGHATLNIGLNQDAQALDDVIVVGMNIRQTKRSITGAMATIQTKELLQSPSANLNNALAGKLPGLITVQSTGQPGQDAASMYIRGVSTYGSNKSPLIVIDGLPRSEGSFSQIDPNEVESISILKDASSSSLYGIQGANGVVVVTTKRGKKDQKPTIELTSQVGILNTTRILQKANTYELASQYYRQYDENSGFRQVWTDEVLESLKKGTADPYLWPDVNWVDELLKKNTHQTQHNINISGSSNFVRYFVSGSFINQGTLLKFQEQFYNQYGKKTGFNRYNFRSNVDIQATKRLSVQIDLAVRSQKETGPAVGFDGLFNSIMWARPWVYPIHNPDGSLGAGSNVSALPAEQNMLGMITQNGYTEHSVNSTYGTVSAKYDLDFITNGLNIQGYYSFENNNIVHTTRSQLYNTFWFKGYDMDMKPIFQPKLIESTLATSGWTNVDNSYYIDLRLNYNRVFSDIHDITLQVLGNRTLKTINHDLPYAYQGLSGRIAYGLLAKYFTEVNLGYNGSENFPKGRRYGFFPAASIGWVASEEPFFKNISWMKYLKFRASYGVVGNDKIGGQRWLYLTDFVAGDGMNFGISPAWQDGFNEGRIGNTFVTWERSYKKNVGFEMSLLKDNLISISLDYFHELRKNILTPPGTVPDYYGLSNLAPINSGKVQNQGVDGEIRIRKFWKDFSTFMNLQGTYAKNKVLENDQPTPQYAYQDLRGYPVGYALGYKSLGLFRDQADIDNSPKQFFDSKNIPGDIKYADTNGNNVIDPGDRIPIQFQNVPTFMFGISCGISYKGLDLSFLLNGATGGTGLYVPSPWDLTEKRVLPYVWSEENKEHARLAIPKNSFNNTNTNSDFYLVKTDYLKLRNMEIGYNVKNPIQGISSIRFFLNGQNLAIWDKLWVKDRDPEVFGGAQFMYPIQRVFNGGVNLQF